MTMIALLSVAVVFTLVGIVLTLLVEWHYFNSLLLKQPSSSCAASNSLSSSHSSNEDSPSFFPRAQLPKELKDSLDERDSSADGETCLALNLFFQFLYRELKDTKKIRRWFMKKLTLEFEELLQKTTTGKLIDQITLKDLSLGTEFPLIKNLNVSRFLLHESKNHIEELDLVMGVEYLGGFRLSVNADLVWGRSAYLAVQITKLSGKVRLQLTRHPFTHWSISFCQEPILEFKVESQFQGRPVPQITSLIISQIRRIIKKKHTLPNCKVRFQPLFRKTDIEEPSEDTNNGVVMEGSLDVCLVECSRLVKMWAQPFYYCTIVLDSLSWTESVVSEENSWMQHDLDIIKLPFQNLGIVCKQELIADKGKVCIVVDNIVADSPASQVDVRKGDILVTMNGTKINSLAQATKLLKQTNSKFSIRLERVSSIHTSKTHECLSRMDEQVLSLKDVESNLCADVMDDFINLKMVEDSDTSPSNTRTQGSPVKRMSGIFSKQRLNESRALLEVSLDQRRKSEGSELSPKSYHAMEKYNEGSQIICSYEERHCKNATLQTTATVVGNPDPVWEEKFTFKLGDKHKYLNIGVWCKRPDAHKSTKAEKDSRIIRSFKNVLVGQVSIPLSSIAVECSSNLQGFHQQTYQLKPPELKPIASRYYKLASHPGFDENLCYGDITLLFINKRRPNVEISLENNQAVTAETLPATTESDDENDSSCSEAVKDKDKDCFSGETRAHEFTETQFKTGTACHFCGKKIWWKVAFQCKHCAMISHKKCVSKCYSLTMCTDDGAKLLPLATDLLQQQSKNPKIITTDATDDQATETATILLAENEKEASSTPPGSPKASLQGNPFPVVDDSDVAEDVSLTVQRLLQHPNDEVLVSNAKEMGKELYIGLSFQERRAKLNSMIKKVQAEIDAETNNRNDLVKCDKETTDPVTKTKIAFQLAKSDERSRALAVLLLHYYSGIQHCQEEEEKPNVQNEEEECKNDGAGARSHDDPVNDVNLPANSSIIVCQRKS